MGPNVTRPLDVVLLNNRLYVNWLIFVWSGFEGIFEENGEVTRSFRVLYLFVQKIKILKTFFFQN